MTRLGPKASSLPSRWSTALRAGIFFIFLVLIICGICFTAWRNKLRKEINTRIASIKAKGLPANWNDLEHWPVVIPDGENAALVLTNVIVQLTEGDVVIVSHLELPPRGEASSAETRSNAVVFVQANLAVLDMVHRVTNAASSRYPINYLDGPNALLPHLKGLKSLSQLLACDAVLKAEANDPAGATIDVESSLHLSRSLDNEPILISQLTSAAILSITSQSLERIICRCALNDDQLVHMSREFSAAEATNRFVTGLIGERAFGNELLRLMQDDMRKMVTVANKGVNEEEQTEMPARNPGFGWKFFGFFARDQNFFLRAMETNILVLSAAPPQSLSLTNELSKIEADAKNGYYIMSSLLLPALSRTAIRDAATRAHLRTAVAGLTIERWRLAHGGKIPESLGELVPALLPSVPIDPFDGKPLRFKKLPNGYVVYSIGMNLQDDGGREQPPRSVKVSKEQRNKFDITFTVER